MTISERIDSAAEAVRVAEIEAAEVERVAEMKAAEVERVAEILELASIRDSWSLKTLLGEARGTVVAWGYPSPMVGGGNNSQQYDVPSGLTDVVGISAGIYHNLVVKKGQQ